MTFSDLNLITRNVLQVKADKIKCKLRRKMIFVRNYLSQYLTYLQSTLSYKIFPTKIYEKKTMIMMKEEHGECVHES